VTDLLEQVEEERWVHEHDAAIAAEMAGFDEEREPVSTAVVAVGVGAGVKRLLQSVGVHEVVAGGQSMNPSTAQILEAVERCGSSSVIVLPNNKNIVPVARQVDGLTDKVVEVIPTTSVVEALAALVSYDPHAPVVDNAKAMAEAASRVAAGEVTQAVRDSKAECGEINAGDWIAIAPAGIVAATGSAADAAFALVDELITEDSEILTVLVGCDANAHETDRLREHLELQHPNVEVEVHEGGQPLYPYLIGVE
jgi:dihydroxyacetone kinase-like predicted kinase